MLLLAQRKDQQLSRHFHWLPVLCVDQELINKAFSISLQCLLRSKICSNPYTSTGTGTSSPSPICYASACGNSSADSASSRANKLLSKLRHQICQMLQIRHGRSKQFSQIPPWSFLDTSSSNCCWWATCHSLNCHKVFRSRTI